MKNYLLILLALMACACGTKKTTETATKTPTDTLYTMPVIPDVAPDKRTWLAEHYWDNVDFADTTWLSHKALLREQVQNFITVMMSGVSKADSDIALRNLLDKASVDKQALLLVAEVLDEWLYDPNSPMRNEAMYVPVLQYIIASLLLDDIDKERPKFQLEMAAKNNPGDLATDFVYTLPDGRTGRLWQLPAPMTLIYFYNPECTGCAETIAALKAHPILSEAIAVGEIDFLALFVDSDQELWRRHFAEMGQGWIVARDNGEVIRNRKLYDLKAIPTLYLLGPEQLIDPSKELAMEKRVLLKDATVEQIDWFLYNLVQRQQQAMQQQQQMPY